VLLYERTKENHKIPNKCRQFHGSDVNVCLPEYSAPHQTDLYLLPLLMEYRKLQNWKPKYPDMPLRILDIP